MRLNALASRRRLLCGLSALPLTGGALAGLPAAAAGQTDAELLRLGADLDEALAAYLDLCERKAEAVRRFKAIEPEIPEAIVRQYPMRGLPPFNAEAPPDHDGAPAPQWRGSFPLLILWPEEAEFRVGELDGRTRAGRYLRRLRSIAERYHGEHQAAREAVKLPTIENNRYEAGERIDEIADATSAIETATVAGMAVKGRAILARHRVRSDSRVPRHLDKGVHSLLRDLARLDGREPVAIVTGEGKPCA